MSGSGAASTGGGSGVLVVENEDDIRTWLCRAFADSGADAVGVGCCSAALDALKGRRFAAAVLDLGMSPIDGKTCGGYIHTLYPDLALVAFTGYPEAADEARIMREHGFLRRYVKGRDEGVLIEEVLRLVRKEVRP